MAAKSWVRMSVASGLGFIGGFVGLIAVAASTSALGLEGGWLPTLAMCGFFAGVLAGVFVAERALAPSGKVLVLAPPAPTGASETDQLPASDELLRLVRAQPKAFSQPALLLVVSFVLFLLVSDHESSFEHLAILVAVLLFHEAGHALGMKAFGYRDVRVFFIPFFGAAASGTPKSPSAWREGVVLLLGPIPGIVLGSALLGVGDDPGTPTAYAARMLLFINAFNLLPVVPLDGGRLFQLMLGKHRVLELALRAASAVALAWLAYSLRDYFLGLIAYLQVVGARLGWSVTSLAIGPGAQELEFPERREDTKAELVEALARRLPPHFKQRPVKTRAGMILLVIERAIAARNTLGPAASAALVAAWGAGVCLAVLALYQ